MKVLRMTRARYSLAALLLATTIVAEAAYYAPVLWRCSIGSETRVSQLPLQRLSRLQVRSLLGSADEVHTFAGVEFWEYQEPFEGLVMFEFVVKPFGLEDQGALDIPDGYCTFALIEEGQLYSEVSTMKLPPPLPWPDAASDSTP